ncbi:MAG: hypothetical protein EBZ50_03125 [Alphaproteobacteria bacterium]|nr:hypothetical protein [Alphaproteobacteria bacterium]
MIDHLFAFASEPAAKAALPAYTYTDEEGAAQWDTALVIRNVRVVTADPTFDEAGEMLTPGAALPGYWLILSTPGDTPNPELVAMTAHRLCAKRETGEILTTGFRADPALMATVLRIDGAPAGSAYPWGAATPPL